MKRTVRPILPLVAMVVWMGFIWGHSMMPATLSAEESGWALAVLERCLHLLHLPEGLTEHIVRKGAHFTEYLILGLLGCAALRPVCWPMRPLATALLGVLVPLIDESIQLFVEGRSGQIQDVWLDIAGFTTGVLLTVFCRAMARRFSCRKRGNDFTKNA